MQREKKFQEQQQKKRNVAAVNKRKAFMVRRNQISIDETQQFEIESNDEAK